MPLYYLSNKYHYSFLIEKIGEYINNNHIDVINSILSTGDVNQHTETILAKYFLEIINDDRLIKLLISQLYRILLLFSQTQKIKSKIEIENKIIDFIFKVYKIKGSDVTILFTLFDFQNNNNYYHFKMIEEGKMSHFSFSDQKYFESVSFCITKMKEKFEDEFKYQKLEFQMKLKEQQEENYNTRNELNNTIKSLLIFNINTNKNNNVNTFNFLKGESPTLILAGILEDTRNEHFQPIGDLLSYLSQE